MGILSCTNCGEFIDTKCDLLHSIEFISGENKGYVGDWCSNCVIDDIPNNVKLKIDGISTISRDGIFLLLN